MKTGLFFWILLGLAGATQAQFGVGFSIAENDSVHNALKRQLQTAKYDTTRITLLEKLSITHLNRSRPDSALAALQQALQLANYGRQPLYVGRVYRSFGNYYHHQQLTVPRIDAYSKAVYFLRKTHRIPEITDTMYDLAKSYAQHTNQAKAIEQINENLAYAKKTRYDRKVGSLYSLLYSIHIRFDDKKGAFSDLQAMQKFTKTHPYPIDKYLTYTMFAEWHSLKKDLPASFVYWKKAFAVAQQLQIPIQTVETCSAMVTNLIEQKDLVRAEYYLHIGIREVEEHHPVSSYIYTAMAVLREQQNRLPEAEQAAMVSLAYTRKINNPYARESVLSLLSRIQEKQGHARQALATFRRLSSLRDSINKLEQIKAIGNVESRFALHEKEKDIELLRKNMVIQQLETARIQQQKVLYSSVAAALLLLLLLMGWIVWLNRQNLRNLNRQNAEISTQSQQLAELNTVKDKLFSLISHDLRTPVLNLKLIIESVNKTSPSAVGFVHQTDVMKRTINSLYYTLDNLLHWAALQQQGVRLKLETVDLTDLVAETLALFDATITQKNIDIRVGPGKAYAKADDGQVQVVIRNIVHNALKFTPTGGRINISFDESDTEAVVRIADTGNGMPERDLQQTAQPRSQPGTKGETGTGLGLVVCDEFMRLNGGRLEIESIMGKGTVVSLVFRPAMSHHPFHILSTQ